jgi:Rrf2 family transcriptional regulator, cysteine metabolism repressor
MKLTTKTRYGTRAMLDLSLHYNEGPISIKDIAQRQDLSQKYLERLLVALQAAGLVRAVRGAKGGYQLSRPPEQITLREIYFVLEGAAGFVDCTAHPQICNRSDMCITHEVWSEMYSACIRILESTTLSDLVQRARRKQTADLYYI